MLCAGVCKSAGHSRAAAHAHVFQQSAGVSPACACAEAARRRCGGSRPTAPQGLLLKGLAFGWGDAEILLITAPRGLGGEASASPEKPPQLRQPPSRPSCTPDAAAEGLRGLLVFLDCLKQVAPCDEMCGLAFQADSFTFRFGGVRRAPGRSRHASCIVPPDAWAARGAPRDAHLFSRLRPCRRRRSQRGARDRSGSVPWIPSDRYPAAKSLERTEALFLTF